jgi:hypothetical protein
VACKLLKTWRLNICLHFISKAEKDSLWQKKRRKTPGCEELDSRRGSTSLKRRESY